ncbi:c6ce32fd-c421-490e-9901-f338966834da [Sclerotinia trifoliorum]|uniref:C6ce32fd-c421-490e-9901-f338966834da n=1 Tax=Sclerotinia trifoliorum TaxID=28548 RepID=A0A8H2W4K8_9HELO|nr:c6ce32fd-c421-490e-9901-f338966834da [Sclerotinia trifoliorum]
MSIFNQSTETSVVKHVPATRSMRRIIASRYLQSIESCPHSISRSTSLSKLTYFALFSNLPFELRAEVWAFALLEPHTIELEFPPLMDTIPQRSFRIKTPHPLLSACKESRAEMLKRYRLSEYSRHNSFSINFAFNSLFLKNLDFGFSRGCWSPTTNTLSSGVHLMLLLGIFDCVESLVISRESILDAECEAENIIRHWFPNLCLLIVTVGFRSEDELVLKRYSQLVLHPEDDRHISVLSSTPPMCQWDAIYASGIKVNMQRRFARQERIHRNYIAPIVNVVSASQRQ